MFARIDAVRRACVAAVSVFTCGAPLLVLRCTRWWRRRPKRGGMEEVQEEEEDDDDDDEEAVAAAAAMETTRRKRRVRGGRGTERGFRRCV